MDNFKGNKRRLMEFAGVPHDVIEKYLAEAMCDKCKCDPCECKEEQEEVKECACGCDPSKCKCPADCKKCNCNKED